MRHHKSVWHGIVPELQTPQVTGSQSIVRHVLGGAIHVLLSLSPPPLSISLSPPPSLPPSPSLPLPQAPHILSGGDSVEECSTTSSDTLLPLPVSPNRTSRNSSTLGRSECWLESLRVLLFSHSLVYSSNLSLFPLSLPPSLRLSLLALPLPPSLPPPPSLSSSLPPSSLSAHSLPLSPEPGESHQLECG